MTSTNIFKGIGEERSSSRVLRPPGGGQTDVLGLSSAPQPAQAKKVNLRNVSSITEGTNFVAEKPGAVVSPVESPQEPPKVEAVPAPAPQKEAPPPQKEAPAPSGGFPFSGAPTPPQSTRARVPPGGYSSGLW